MIPVIFIHKGNSKYLYNTFFQLKKTSPSTKAYVIGTAESKVYEPLIEHVSIYAFHNEANSFGKIYTHFSTNSAAFELVCIQRWFVLKEFMIQNNIDRCLYLDSDVLMYEDVQVLSQKYSRTGMTLCGISGHTNFIDKNVLIDFCNFVCTVYSSPKAQIDLETYYHAFVAKHGGGGVSDMTLLTWYADAHPGNITNIYHIDGSPTFDPSMAVEEYFEMDGTQRAIFFKDQRPYGTLRSDGKHVLFYSLHFQGGEMKKIMPHYITNKKTVFYCNQFYYVVLYYLQKIKSNLKYKFR